MSLRVWEPLLPRVQETEEIRSTLNLLYGQGIKVYKVSRKGTLDRRTMYINHEAVWYMGKHKVQSLYFQDIWDIRTDPGAGRLKLANYSTTHYGLGILSLGVEEMAFIFPSKERRDNVALAIGFRVAEDKRNITLTEKAERLWKIVDQTKIYLLTLLQVIEILRIMDVSFTPQVNVKIRKFLSERVVNENNPIMKQADFMDFLENFYMLDGLREIYVRNKKTDEEMTTAEYMEMQKSGTGETTEYSNYLSTNQTIGFVQFCKHLLNPKNSWFDPEKQSMASEEVMSYSLHNYYINSSNRTYLTGNQVNSVSDIDMYRRTLYSGCRYVELDCWDGADGNPVIYRGWTLTSKIPLRGVLEAIKESAWMTSDYPVILYIENNTSNHQGSILASTLVDVLGDDLCTQHEFAEKDFTPLALKNRILIMSERVLFEENEENKVHNARHVKNSTNQSTLLSSLIAIPCEKNKDYGITAEPSYAQNISESLVGFFARYNKKRYIAMNSRMITHVYPDKTRLSSSNFDPNPSWSGGSQIVALNYQTWDIPLHINDAMFNQNGRCGYVLKPDYLRDTSIPFRQTSVTLKVTVICGFQLPLPKPMSSNDPVSVLVVLQLHGLREDKSIKNTECIDIKGFDPFWNKSFVFNIQCKEHAFLSVGVKDGQLTSNDLIAAGAVPVSCMREGYRIVPLRLCKDGKRLEHSCILLHIRII